jgi:hypothetical protein
MADTVQISSPPVDPSDSLMPPEMVVLEHEEVEEDHQGSNLPDSCVDVVEPLRPLFERPEESLDRVPFTSPYYENDSTRPRSPRAGTALTE